MIDLSSSMRVGAAVLVLALAAGTPAAARAQAAADATSFRATVYGWFPGLSGTTEFPSGAAGPSLNVNAKNVVDSLKMVFMGTLEVQQGRWGGLVDWVYSDLGSTKAGTRDFVIHGQALAAGVAADLSLDVKTNILTLAGTYSFIDQPSYSTGLVFGARMLDMDQTLDWSFVGTGPAGLARTGRSEVSATNWDAIVGVRGRARFGNDLRWFVPYYADIGTGTPTSPGKRSSAAATRSAGAMSWRCGVTSIMTLSPGICPAPVKSLCNTSNLRSHPNVKTFYHLVHVPARYFRSSCCLRGSGNSRSCCR